MPSVSQANPLKVASKIIEREREKLEKEREQLEKERKQLSNQFVTQLVEIANQLYPTVPRRDEINVQVYNTRVECYEQYLDHAVKALDRLYVPAHTFTVRVRIVPPRIKQ